MPDADEDPDAELVASIGRGDHGAFRLLVARKLGRVHGLAARLLGDAGLADDVSQEALLRVWRRAGAWQPGAARFDTWLHQVVLNLCRDRLRRRREVLVAEVPDQADPTPSAECRLQEQAAAGRVRAAIGRLPPRQREAVVLQMYGEMGNIEAAKAMGISVEALESLLGRARRTLRAALTEEAP
ncbi:MAG: RNA polymerase sigma factor [Janthinobacterium lividum]